jgi:cysteine desulfurase family protein (TIGR01976 family)
VTQFPIERVRAEFPALSVSDNGMRRIYLDNPAGTQVPRTVADAVSHCLLETNANLGGAFRTSVLAGEAVNNARRAIALFLGAASEREIVIGPTMTSIAFHLSRSIARTLRAGDEIVVTRMDHDGNISPWLAMAEDLGLTVRWVPFDRDTWQIEPHALDTVLSEKTRIVALNYASNLTGSINNIRALVDRVHAAGALAFVDAVQFAPHGFIDVAALDCDFLACSPYKFFGPHLGIVWGREQLLEELRAYKVRPATNDLPWRFENGTTQIELLAALPATVEYFERLGADYTNDPNPRNRIRAAFEAASAWERNLTQNLIDGLQTIPGVRIIGITASARVCERVPTVSFVHEAVTPNEIAAKLATENIFVWSGHNFALEVVRSLGIDEDQGVVRIGAAHYNTPEEIEATLRATSNILTPVRSLP